MDTLQPLHPADLLESLAVASKTGTLSVETSDGKSISIDLVNGKPTRARKVPVESKGQQALNDFLSRCQKGKFTFRDGVVSEDLGFDCTI